MFPDKFLGKRVNGWQILNRIEENGHSELLRSHYITLKYEEHWFISIYNIKLKKKNCIHSFIF